ncbi:Dual specificity protein kinase KNS1 [Talaromyces islandicus]|uniref:Dual specificity protein kinase KNS1 n=1 Tax=Talaromyces islandicus TaxID=28573 RepID=A0A0U1LIE8_TALIS|nr:Dual specificity protein kinase KNS1 [Talaromyces islandicus]
MEPTLDLRKQEEGGFLIHDQWAMKHANLAVKETWNKIIDDHQDEFEPGTVPAKIKEGDKLPTAPKPSILKPPRDKGALQFKVGIIGAGAAGLFTGMILDWLANESNPKIKFDYDILEASDRVGGRMYTYNFPGNTARHNYYDVGAMRFPDNPIMKRLFLLFEWLKMRKTLLRDECIGNLVPYYLNADQEPWNFNDRTEWGTYASISSRSADPWGINGDSKIPPEILKASPDDVLNALTEPLRNQLEQDLAGKKPSRKGWDMLMEYDNYSTRSFLHHCHLMELGPAPPFPSPPYNYETIQWLETIIGGTNWFDQAFSETVLESLDFQYNESTEWWCILGGTSELAEKMKKSLNDQSCLRLCSRVTKIEACSPGGMKVSVGNEADPREYEAVFSTVPFGCLRHIDTRDANLSYPVKQAMRTLSYGPTAKVGIKFKRAWWIHDLRGNNLKKAGLGHSDLGIRTCVYPSYNIEDPAGDPAVLLCSYTWQQDALRLAPLISRNPDPEKKMQEEEQLKGLIFRDLARMHASQEVPESEVYKLIQTNYEMHYAFSWDQNPDSVGGFGFFGPQQFRSAWGSIIQPQGDLYMVGEAASPHHAWVVGAIESSQKKLIPFREKKYVAIKVSVSESEDDRGNREAQILKKLAASHPSSQHIMCMLDDFNLEGPNGTHKCLVFELLGPSVPDIIETHFSDGRLPGKLAKDIAKQTLAGVDTLHQHNIGHGDLHTRNLAFTMPGMDDLLEGEFIEALGKPEIGHVRRNDGNALEAGIPEYIVRPAVYRSQSWSSHQIKIIDFGESFLQSSVPQTLHTPLPVRAPEIIFHDTLDYRVDLWSMGCMLFELFVGQPPFDSVLTTPAILVSQMQEMASDPLPVRWKDLLETTHSKSPADIAGPTLQQWLEEMYFDGERKQNLTKADIVKLGYIIGKLLLFEPSTRASAREIPNDPWFSNSSVFS